MDRLTLRGTKEAKSDVTIRQVIDKLAEYEDLEEQGKLIKLRKGINYVIYVIPSDVNYKLNILNGHEENNRIYRQVIDHIEIHMPSHPVYFTCEGLQCVGEQSFGKTWFIDKEEAEKALEEKKLLLEG